MPKIWRNLQRSRFWLRIPIKLAIFAVVVLFVLFPYPRLLARHIQHLRHLDTLIDPGDPAVAALNHELDGFLAQANVTTTQPAELLPMVQSFVYGRIPYAYDWDNWGVADYIPTVSEVLAKGREDCDGRAVVAAALLRARGIPAELAGDPRHVWVRTPQGDTMNPLGPPVFSHDAGGTHVRWTALVDTGPFAFGTAVFPLGRELVILLAAWLLLLPPAIRPGAAMVVGWLLVEALVILRVAGINPEMPHYGGIAWSGLHLLAAAWILLRFRLKGLKEPVGRY